MEAITVELLGTKYLIVELPITSRNTDEVMAKCKRHNAIYQGVKEINKGGLFSNTYMVIRVLVPESSVIAFNAESK